MISLRKNCKNSPCTNVLFLSYNGQSCLVDLVEDEIIIEVKAVEGLLPVHEAQIISYLKLANKRLGFLVNFNVPLLKDGFKRFVHNF